MEVTIVIDEYVLNSIVISRDRYHSFLRWWINEQDTKAVVIKKIWLRFIREKEEELKEFKETSDFFFGSVRGIITPYREKYAEETQEPTDMEIQVDEVENEIDATLNIANRHYATCRYIIVRNPENYKGKEVRIGDGRILSPQEFYSLMEVMDNKKVIEFNNNFSE